MDKKKKQYEQALERKKKVKEEKQIEEQAKKLRSIKYKYKLLSGFGHYFYYTKPLEHTCTPCAFDLPYFHHGCDFVDDVGWGKGYRVLQMMCIYMSFQLNRPEFPVPSIHDIQKILVRIGHKPQSFQRLKEPIGAKEAMLVIETLFNHKAKLIETTGAHLKNYFKFFCHYYNAFSMLSTDSDEDCRGICDALHHNNPKYISFNLVDPGCTEVPKSIYALKKKGYIYWKNDNEYDPEKKISICYLNMLEYSYYNI